MNDGRLWIAQICLAVVLLATAGLIRFVMPQDPEVAFGDALFAAMVASFGLLIVSERAKRH